MSELRQAMHDYVNEVTLGPAPRTDVLRRRLRDIQARNARYFALPVVMLAVLFVVALGLSIHYASATTVTAISTGFGISVVAMIRLMLSFWREKVATELVIELSELDDDLFRKAVAQLLRWMK